METTPRQSRIPRLSTLPLGHRISNVSTQDPFSSSVASKTNSCATEQEVQIIQESLKESGEISPGQRKRNRIVETPRKNVEDKSSCYKTLPARRRPRPSLSDRTADTLAQIPLSVSPKKRRSSFFQSNSPNISPIRPATSMARARPSSSMALRPPIPDFPSNHRPLSPTKQHLAPTTGNRVPPRTPVKVGSGRFIPQSLPPPRPRFNEAMHLTPSKQKAWVPGRRSDNHTPIPR